MSLLSCLRLLFSKLTLRYSHPPSPSPMSTPPASSPSSHIDNHGITHHTLHLNGINIHFTEKGSKHHPTILFLHGFPDLWYTWRHQILTLSNLGYRTIAPDLRGYGATDAPPDPTAYTYFHTVGDLIALMDAIEVDKVFVVAHDWGAMVGWHLCLFRPDRVKAFVALSVPFPPRMSKSSPPVERLRDAFGDDYYVCRFQCPGEIEAEIAEVGGINNFLRKFFTYRESAPLYLPKGKRLLKEAPPPPPPLPPFLSEEEFNYYLNHYERTGLTGGLNYYRAINLNWDLMAPWTGAQVKVPVKFIVGDLDLTICMDSTKDYVCKGGMNKFVPLLEVVVMEGVGHFIQQERGDEITNHIYEFIQKFT